MRPSFSWLNHEITRHAAQFGIMAFGISTFKKLDTEYIQEIRRLQKMQDVLRDEVDQMKHAANATRTSNSTTSNERMPATTVSK